MRTLILITLLLLASCAGDVLVSPLDEPLHSEQTLVFFDQIIELGRDGDWLVTRGYHSSDVFVSGATGSPLSHAAVLDLSRGEVIEAEAAGIHSTDLRVFVDKSHRIQLIRPVWSTAEKGRQAVARARALIGSPYDLPGIFGIDCPDRYYCSELTVHVYNDHVRDSDEIPNVIEPGQLHHWGTVLYDSGPRDAAENQF